MIFIYSFLGGLFLNFMPCVLPVVLIKLSGLIQHPENAKKYSLLFSLGIITVFSCLGVLASLFGLTWGTQFQDQNFLSTLYYISFIMGLQLVGLFQLPVSSKMAGGPYFTGVLATLISTPCTGPFMALPLAWSATQNALTGLLVFLSMGLGMASPYLVSCFIPVVNFLPKPGYWMQILKELSGYCLLAACIWMLSFSMQIIPLLIISLLGALTVKYLPKYKLIALLLIIPLYFFPAKKMESNWIPYSPELVEYLESTNKKYFIDFTADWCLICQSNKPKLESLKSREKDVVFIRADFTNDNRDIERALDELNKVGLPVCLYWNGHDNIVEDLNDTGFD